MKRVTGRVDRLRREAGARDAAMSQIRLVRRGEIASVAPEFFTEGFDKSLIANFIDTAARDLSELMAPLPTLVSSATTATSKASKDFASKKTNVGYAYWYASKLERQMFTACDQFLSYGFLPLLVEPNYDLRLPFILCADPSGSYYAKDRFGDVTVFAEVRSMSGAQLADLYPEFADEILHPRGALGKRQDTTNSRVELVRYFDAERTLAYLPACDNLVLGDVPQPLGKCPVRVVERTSIEPGLVRGQFDDAVPVQIARAYMAQLGVQAAAKSVQAPLVLPDDANNIPFGPDAIIRTREPQNVRRVGMELPPGAFQSEALLEQELRMGARYPDARSGDMTGSIVTGRGVQALLGQIDTQIKTAQALLGDELARITELAYELDEKVWPSATRTVRAMIAGTAIEETYRPDKAIAGDYRCDCVYGFASGLGVNQAVVMIEQMINGGLIDRATGRRHLPLGEDPIKLETALNLQQVRDGLMQGLAAMAQSTNVMVENGQDPSPLLAKIAQATRMLSTGSSVEDVVEKMFPPPPPPSPDQSDPAASQPGQPGQQGDGSGAPNGMDDLTGLPMRTAAPGQPPGGRPPMSMLMAGLSPSGKAQLSDNISQRVASPI